MLGDEDDSTGLPIKPVDQGKLAAVGEFIDTKSLEPFEEGRGVPRLSRMDNEVSRLVDEEKVLVFKDDGEFRALEAKIDGESYSFSVSKSFSFSRGTRRFSQMRRRKRFAIPAGLSARLR